MDTYQQCIIPSCGRTHDVSEVLTGCICGNLLDVKYRSRPDKGLKEVFYERRSSRGNIFDESGVWGFRELINFVPGIDIEDYDSYSRVLVTYDGDEGKTKPFHLTKVAQYIGIKPENFWLQFEGNNPTGSFKDNGMATAFTHAKMLGVKRVACASTGNTGASMAAYAANELFMEGVVFVGEGKIAVGKLAQILAYGAKILEIKGDFDDAMARIKEAANKRNIYLVNSLNPFRLEGQKTIMYRVLDYFDWEVPDWIVFPGGNLGNTAAFGKAFTELKEWGWIKKVPRIAVVNAAGADTLYTLYNDWKLKWNMGNVDDEAIEEYYSYLDEKDVKAKTKATAIQILKPVNLKKALRTLELLDGVVEEVSDHEILDAMAVVGKNGFGCEPASSASVAGIKKLVEKGIVEEDETTVGILTGHILKDPSSIIEYHSNLTNRFANPPRKVENDLRKILAAIETD
ncbi:MAG: threonine synthase [Nitrososphaeria archaeon]|nr:threonine synthase [Nitrososphaeria archaeon]NIN52668.1 threonine synthase [Nitrososphaeria archaeon]NIQ33143.1 threonine synthase [Nitrososphaeria archaeon]